MVVSSWENHLFLWAKIFPGYVSHNQRVKSTKPCGNSFLDRQVSTDSRIKIFHQETHGGPQSQIPPLEASTMQQRLHQVLA